VYLFQKNNPEQTLYARVIMTSTVISTIDGNTGGEPTVSDAAPIIDLTGIGFTFVPLAPGLGDTLHWLMPEGIILRPRACSSAKFLSKHLRSSN
jgi:hypothetical protein